MDLSIKDLLKIKGARIINENSIHTVKFKNVSIDSRKCAANDLFFAIKGERFDGHDFVKGCTEKKQMRRC